MVGLVVGSIRSLALERGHEKMAARIVEKRRSDAVHNVDARRQTIKISWLAKADFDTDPSQSPAQRREEEFNGKYTCICIHSACVAFVILTS